MRVMVPEVWDWVELAVERDTTVAEVKREGLSRALGRLVPPGDYEVKFHGAAVADDATLASIGAAPGAPFIILALRRHPVR